MSKKYLSMIISKTGFGLALMVFLMSCMKPHGIPGDQEGNTIKIGIIGPMSAYQGVAHWNGALLAKEEINHAGGIRVGGNVMKILLYKADSNEINSSYQAVKAIKRLIKNDKVDFIVGGCKTAAVLQMQETAMRYKKIFLGCGSAHQTLCTRVANNYQKFKYWFRVSPANEEYLTKQNFLITKMVTDVVRKELKIIRPKIAILAENAPWAKLFIDIAQRELTKMNVEVVGTWWTSKASRDVKRTLMAIQHSNAHIVFTAFTDKSGITVARQAIQEPLWLSR